MRQAAGNKYRNYLVRVEGISIDCKFGFSENVKANDILTTTRQQFCLHLKVTGLRNPKLHKRMMAKTNLILTALKAPLIAMTRASESDYKLCKATTTADVTVKQEPWKAGYCIRMM